MTPLDTAPDAQAAQDAAYRRMSPAEKLRAVLDLSHTMREFARCGVRLRHPHLDEAGVTRQLVKDLYGIDLPAR